MDDIQPVRHPYLSEQIYKIILKGISDGTYPPRSILPSENQFANEFDVSRPTIRAAISILVAKGFVKRSRGVGTFVADKPNFVSPLNQLLNVAEWITARGSKPGFRQLKSEIINADEELAEALRLETGSEIALIHKLFTADDEPIIYFINYIPVWVFQGTLTEDKMLKPGVTEPFFKFFSETCNHRVSYLSSIIRTELVEDIKLPEDFDLDHSNKTVLVIEDTGFDENDTPLFLSIEHLTKNAGPFHIVRYVDNI